VRHVTAVRPCRSSRGRHQTERREEGRAGVARAYRGRAWKARLGGRWSREGAARVGRVAAAPVAASSHEWQRRRRREAVRASYVGGNP
jgi:hypothetical protein